MSHIHAFDPKVKPRRMLVEITDGRRKYAHVTPVLYTSLQRCQVAPNPKRPTWRCKAKPTKFVSLPWTTVKGKGVAGLFVCDEHVEIFRRMTP